MEEFSVKVEPNNLPQQQMSMDEDLFQDMTPVFQKPKKVIANKSNNNNIILSIQIQILLILINNK